MRARLLLLLGLARAALPAPAHAHVFAHPKTLRLGVKGDHLLLFVSLDLNPGDESSRARGVFDGNADGQLDGDEQARLLRYLEDTALLFLELSLDGQPATFTAVERVPVRADRPARSSESVGAAFLYRWPIDPNRRTRIHLADRDKDRSKHVPVVVDLGADRWVHFASQGELLTRAGQLARVALKEGAPLILDVGPKP